jgi:hypothetical protein
VRGAFIGQTQASIAKLVLGQPWNATEGVTATIEAKDAPRPSVARVRISPEATVAVPMEGQLEVPAPVVITCPTHVGPGGVLRCATAGTILAPDMHLSLQGPSGLLRFRIDQVDGVVTKADRP